MAKWISIQAMPVNISILMLVFLCVFLHSLVLSVYLSTQTFLLFAHIQTNAVKCALHEHYDAIINELVHWQ